ncbi:MAG: DoxX family protein [Bacteroidota bacterium]
MRQSIQQIFHWVIKIIAALIMLQTLYFKFSASEESVYIFTQMYMEPWGRYATGIAELTASLLILYRATTFIGAMLTLGIMSGAIAAHLFVLGVEVKNDHGLLFIYALVTWLLALILIWLNRQQLIDIFNKFKKLRQD